MTASARHGQPTCLTRCSSRFVLPHNHVVGLLCREKVGQLMWSSLSTIYVCVTLARLAVLFLPRLANCGSSICARNRKGCLGRCLLRRRVLYSLRSLVRCYIDRAPPGIQYPADILYLTYLEDENNVYTTNICLKRKERKGRPRVLWQNK